MSQAIATLAIGRAAAELGAITFPLMQAYARRIGAAFVVFDQPRIGSHIMYEKLQVHDLLERHERVLYLDNDLLVSPGCPDLFQRVPADHFGAFMVSRYTALHDPGIEQAQARLGDIGWQRDYFNAGVMLCSRPHRFLFAPQGLVELLWWDQTLLNYRVQRHRVPIFDIGYRFNHTTAPGNSQQRFQSHIIHYPGPSAHRPGSKPRKIAADRRVLCSPVLRRLYRIPWFARCYERWT